MISPYHYEAENAFEVPQTSSRALANVIPDDPDYRRHIPIEYRLDAKELVGYLAQDLSRGRSAHLWTELAHLGIAAGEIFAASAAIVEGLALAAPVLGVVGPFLALGAPLQEAAKEIAERWAATGYSRGAVMGSDGRSASLLRDYYGNDYFPPNYSFPAGRNVAIANYRVGLFTGYVNGRVLSKNQRAIFWHDLGHRMGSQSWRGPVERWGRREHLEWYTDVAAAFKRDHLVPTP